MEQSSHGTENSSLFPFQILCINFNSQTISTSENIAAGSKQRERDTYM